MFEVLEELKSCVSVINGAEVGDPVCGGVMGEMENILKIGKVVYVMSG